MLAAGPRTADELAAVTQTDARSLYRILRVAAGLGLFVEDEMQRFALTSLGATLKTGAEGHARSTVLIQAGPAYWAAYSEILHVIRTGGTAMEKVHGANLFDYLAERPVDAQRFNETMIGIHGAEPAAVAAAYDFSKVGTLVDVGGGTGNLLTTILETHAGLRGVLFDMPHVAREARARIAARGLTSRCEAREGNFFESVFPGGDAYMLSHIIHDWDDARCVQILDNCRRAMGPEGRLLLVEMLIPEGNDPHPGKIIDFIMLAITGGVERTTEEYASLLRRAGFRMTQVVPTQSAVSVIEALPA
jgi:ubiquinone/menaquinone biosynthesis C-methylase UbiE